MKKTFMLAILTICLVVFLILLPSSFEKKPIKIGVLLFTGLNVPTLKGFKDELKDLGYVEGENINYIFKGLPPSKQQLKEYMSEVLKEKPDLIFSSPTPSTIVAKEMTEHSGIPVVFAPVNDPVSAGIVKNIRSPEANLTGVRLSSSDGRRLESLTEVVPGVQKIFVPFSPKDRSAKASLSMLEKAAEKLNLTLIKKPFYKETDILADPDYVPSDIDAIVLPREGLVMSRIHAFVELCLERKLPLSSPRYTQVEQGALTGYGFNGYEIGRQAARLAHMIISGTPVSSLPVETSTDYLFINLKTADALGLTVDDAVLRQAHNIVR